MSERQRTTVAARAGEGRRQPGGLRRRAAIPLAIGSVAGSGILFLPSAVYVEAGRNSLLVWLLSTALCLPLLLMFQDMVRADPGGDGIQAFVRAGLGEVLGRCVPLLFVSLVIVGLPAGALVAGRYVARALGAGEAVTVVAALAVLLAALAVNLAGVRASTRVQHAGTWALVAMALVLLGSAATGGGAGLSGVTPDGGDLGVLLPGVVLAMWTFAGFENLTFLSRELRRPERDFLPVSATALGLYGLLTVLLTVAIAVRVPRGQVDEVVGLLQLARSLRPRQGVVAAVTVIAFGAMTLNAVAWVWGVSRVVARAAAAAILPPPLARNGRGGVPRRAVLLLGGLFAVSLTVLVAVPGILVDAVAAASAIFIVLYLLCIVSYLRVRGLAPRPLANLLLLPPLAASLVQSGWRSLYGAAVLLVALAAQLVGRRTGRAAARTTMATPVERCWEELAAARLLAGEGFEAQAVSRSYFAAFFAAEAALLTLGETRSKHPGVISAFVHLLVRGGHVDQDIGRLLRSLFERRNEADYAPVDVPAEEADAAIRDAERVVNAVQLWLTRRRDAQPSG